MKALGSQLLDAMGGSEAQELDFDTVSGAVVSQITMNHTDYLLTTLHPTSC